VSTFLRRHFLWIAALLFTLAAIFAFLRHQRTTLVLTGDALSSPETVDVTWDRATGLITRTGNDPYLWFDVPASAIPIRRAVFEFRGDFRDTEGTFYLFHAPAHFTGLILGPVIAGTVTRAENTFTVSADIPQSKVLRLDLPDFLIQPIELRQLTLETSFIAPADPFFRLFILFTVAGLVVLVSRFIQHRSAEFALVATLIALKLGLSTDLHLSFGGHYGHDDAHFIRQADSILQGKWLGNFNHLTLSKGPVYPLFLAATARLGIPLLLAQTLLHAFACIAFLLALRPLLRSPGLRLLLFTALLFDPYTLSASATGRVLRTGVQPALALLALAATTGAAVHATRSIRALAAWSTLAGLAVSAFWYSREEGIWLLPSLVLVTAAAALTLLRPPLPSKKTRYALLALPFVLFLLATFALRTINTRHYGAPVIVDVRDGALPDAYGALLRITPAELIPGVPVTKESRLRAYVASPAFAELQPHLEGAVGDGWAQQGWEVDINHPSARREIRGGWFQWALRDAGLHAGHYRTAATASAYWQRVADEINTACDHGHLAAGAPRRGFFPPWHASLNPPLRDALRRAFRVVTQFADFTLLPERNNGNEAIQSTFARITHEPGVSDYPIPGLRSQLRTLLFHLYSGLGAAALLLALAATAVLAVQTLRRRAPLLHLIIVLALAGGVCALILIVSLVDVTSFFATHAGYLSPATPLALALFVLAPAWAWRSFRPAPSHPNPAHLR
jgi:hypothetical protein